VKLLEKHQMQSLKEASTEALQYLTSSMDIFLKWRIASQDVELVGVVKPLDEHVEASSQGQATRTLQTLARVKKSISQV
jgi:hypothetical protein